MSVRVRIQLWFWNLISSPYFELWFWSFDRLFIWQTEFIWGTGCEISISNEFERIVAPFSGAWLSCQKSSVFVKQNWSTSSPEQYFIFRSLLNMTQRNPNPVSNWSCDHLVMNYNCANSKVELLTFSFWIRRFFTFALWVAVWIGLRNWLAETYRS